MKSFFKTFKDFFKVYQTTKLFLILLIIMVIVLFGIDMIWVKGGLSNPEFVENLLVEAHGVLGDLVIFGVILTIYDTYRNTQEEKKRKEIEREVKIERLIEEIDDYKGWFADEAKFRIIGNIKRLHRIDSLNLLILENCYLKNCRLNLMNFKLCVFSNSDLSNSNFDGTKFYNCNFKGTSLSNCFFGLYMEDLEEYSQLLFKHNNFENTNLQGAVFSGINFSNTNFIDAKLNGLILAGTDLVKGANSKSKDYIKDKFEILNYEKYYNTLSEFDVYDKGYNDECFIDKNLSFLVKKEDAEEYKKNNKRIPKEKNP